MQEVTEPRPTDETPIRYVLTQRAISLLGNPCEVPTGSVSLQNLQPFLNAPIPFELVRR